MIVDVLHSRNGNLAEEGATPPNEEVPLPAEEIPHHNTTTDDVPF